MPEQTPALPNLFAVLAHSDVLKTADNGLPDKVAHLVHTHIWNVDIHLDDVPRRPNDLHFHSPAIDFRPLMLPLTDNPVVLLSIAVDHRNGHRVRVVPPAWDNHLVAFHTDIDIVQPKPSAQLARLRTNGLLTPHRRERPMLRLPPGTTRIHLRHCAVYRALSTVDGIIRLGAQLGSAQPRRTWQRSVIYSPTRGPLFKDAADAAHSRRLSAMADRSGSRVDSAQHPEVVVPAANNRLATTQPILFSEQFETPHANIPGEAWHLQISLLQPEQPVHPADAWQSHILHLKAPDRFDLGGAGVQLIVYSVQQPLDARQSFTFELPQPVKGAAGTPVNTADGCRRRISDPMLLAALLGGDQFAFELHATTLYMVSPEASRQWQQNLPAKLEFCDTLGPLSQLRDLQERTHRPPYTDHQLSPTDERELEIKMLRVQFVFRHMLDDSSAGNWTLQLRGGETAIVVDAIVLRTRAPRFASYLQRIWPDGRRVFDVDILCLNATGLRRLLGHIYALDALQEGDDLLQLMGVAFEFMLYQLKDEAQQSWLNENPPGPNDPGDHRMHVLRHSLMHEGIRIRHWMAPPSGVFKGLRKSERSKLEQDVRDGMVEGFVRDIRLF